jgi:BirA family biotin operon repressor/biotin-[acetyl-CoA-carboxylase] ligase
MNPETGTRIAVLKELLEAGGETVSGGVLCRTLGLSRQSVWKAVRSLQEDGHSIEAVPVKGYRYVSPPDNDLDPSMLEALLFDCPWGHPVLHWERLGSTQTPVKELARKGAREGLVVMTGYQTSGRGRLGRRWESSPEGGIYFSILTRPAIPPESIQILSLVSAMSVQDSIRSVCGIQCQLKWPNDIYWDGAKICGILTEVSSEPGLVHFAVTGIGINANYPITPMEAEYSTASLFSILGKKVNRGKLIAEIIRELHKGVRILESPGGVGRTLADYEARSDTIGKTVRVLSEGGEIIGKAVGIGTRGDLLVRIGEEVRSFSAADISHLRSLP